MSSLKYIAENITPLSRIVHREITPFQYVYERLQLKRFKKSHRPFHIRPKNTVTVIEMINSKTNDVKCYASSYEISTSMNSGTMKNFKVRARGETLNRLDRSRNILKLSNYN